jgi:hypothetical protein
MLTESQQQDTRGRIADLSANAGTTLSLNLDAQNPWPGLAAYDEVSRDFFHGRDREATELLRLIRLAPLTALYGKSGLGKSSLLQAGLFPLLRANHYLPVNLRLDYAEGTADSIFEGVKDRLVGELERAGAEFPPPGDESLWEYLHHKDIDIWTADNFPLTPVLVFDQFEELFSRNIRKPQRVDEIFNRLGDLIENRIPAELSSDAAKAKRSKLDLGSQRYRIVLSFREDFLAEVQTWERRIPSLLRNYLRLEPMSRARAIEAVERSGADVLERDVAPIIVDFVGGQGAESSEAAATVIEPVLLSLCCYQLNRQRHGKKIDRLLVDRVGHDILDSFYRGALANEDVEGPPDVSAFIENFLIQGDHFRGTYPRTEALSEGLLTERQLAALTDRHRLLRVVPYADTQRIELIHDRLVPTVRKARDERQAREHQKAEAERQKAKADDDLRRTKARATRAIAVLLAVIVFFACASAIAFYKLWTDAAQEGAKAVAQSREADLQRTKAEEKSQEADSQRSEADRQRAEADRQRGEADKQRAEADSQRAAAELARNAAMAAQRQAELAWADAERARNLEVQARGQAETRLQESQENQSRYILEVARSKIVDGNGELASLLVLKTVRENLLGPQSPL